MKSLDTKFWRGFIECIGVVPLKFAWVLIHFCLFSLNSQNRFSYLVFFGFGDVFEGLKLLNGGEFGYQILAWVYWVYSATFVTIFLCIGTLLILYSNCLSM